MARQHVHALAAVVARVEQAGVHAAPGLRALRRFVHAVVEVVAVGQRLVHPDDDRPDGRVGHVARERPFEPGELRVVELVVRRVVEIEERHAAIDPVEVRLDARVVRAVDEPLGAQRRRVVPRPELRQELRAGLREDHFVVADADQKRNRAERRHLVVHEVLPLHRVVLVDRQGRGEEFLAVHDVFVGAGRPAQIAQVPVERRVVLPRRLRDGRHHDVAAVAGVARYQERPRFGGRAVLLGADQPAGRQHAGSQHDRGTTPVGSWRAFYPGYPGTRALSAASFVPTTRI